LTDGFSELLGTLYVLTLQPVAANTLKGKFTVKHTATKQLKGILVIRHPGNNQIKGKFDIRRTASVTAVRGDFIVQHSTSRTVRGGLNVSRDQWVMQGVSAAVYRDLSVIS
jgi:hypothetical protein